MNEIVELADRLGKAIGESPQAAGLRAARAQLNADKDLTGLLEGFRAQAGKIAELEQQKKPIEVGDKHKLQEIQDKLAGSDIFKKFTAAQVDYVDLMRRVNDALRKQLIPTEEG